MYPQKLEHLRHALYNSASSKQRIASSVFFRPFLDSYLAVKTNCTASNCRKVLRPWLFLVVLRFPHLLGKVSERWTVVSLVDKRLSEALGISGNLEASGGQWRPGPETPHEMVAFGSGRRVAGCHGHPYSRNKQPT